MDKALKQQLFGVIEVIYVRALHNNYTGNRNHMCLQVIDELKANYQKITPWGLKMNTAKTNVPHNINKQFKTIIGQIETSIDFANISKIPYAPEQAMTASYDLIFITGYFNNACC